MSWLEGQLTTHKVSSSGDSFQWSIQSDEVQHKQKKPQNTGALTLMTEKNLRPRSQWKEKKDSSALLPTFVDFSGITLIF